MRTLEQEYASTVLPYIEEIAIKKEAFRKSYGNMAHQLPVLIRTAGLVQALHFVDSRTSKPLQQQLLMDLALTVGCSGTDEFLKTARKAELAEYIHLTQRTLSALLWFKRYAQSILNVEAGDEDTETQAEQEAANEHTP